MSRMVYRVVWVPSLIAIIGMTIAFGKAPATAPTPGKLIQWEAGDKSFSIMRPDNWRPQAMGAAGTLWKYGLSPRTSSISEPRVTWPAR